MHAYTPAPAPEQTRGRCSATGYQQRLPHRPGVPAAAGADAGTTPTALLPLNRTVVRDLGVHPRGEFRTSGAAVGQKVHGPRQRPSFSNAEDCLSSEGGRQGLPARRPSVESDGASRAPREAEGEPCARCDVRRTAPAEARAPGPGLPRRTTFFDQNGI